MDNSKQSVDIFNKVANLYEEKYMDVSLYHKSLDLFCKSIKKQNAEILELACGPGNITKYLLSKRPDFKILGTDLAPNMIELAKKNNPTAQFELMDSRDISSVEKKYDGIMIGFALPYLSKEEAIHLIADASKILNQHGVIYISTMEDAYSKSRFQKGSTGDEIFMHYHEAEYLINALEKNSFGIVEVMRQDFNNSDGSKAIDLIIVAKK